MLHHYRQLDYYNNGHFNAYKKYITDKKGGGVIYGNNKATYDFEIKNNRLFVGDPHMSCIDIEIENSEAYIIWLGHKLFIKKLNQKHLSGEGVESCTHYKNAKHLFLWALIVLLKYFPNIQKISLGDDTKIRCGKNLYYLQKYYFLRYGKSYYEYYFNFEIEFHYSQLKKNYEKALKKRQESKIKKQWVINFFAESNNFVEEFIDLFGQNDEMKITDYLNLFTKDIRQKYCNMFYPMVNLYYDEFISIYLPTGFVYEIKNKDEFLAHIHDKIKKLFP